MRQEKRNAFLPPKIRWRTGKKCKLAESNHSQGSSFQAIKVQRLGHSTPAPSPSAHDAQQASCGHSLLPKGNFGPITVSHILSCITPCFVSIIYDMTWGGTWTNLFIIMIIICAKEKLQPGDPSQISLALTVMKPEFTVHKNSTAGQSLAQLGTQMWPKL